MPVTHKRIGPKTKPIFCPLLDSCAQSAVTMGGSPESLDNRCSGPHVMSDTGQGLHIRHDHPPLSPGPHTRPDSLLHDVTVPENTENTPAPPPIYPVLSSLCPVFRRWADGRDGRLVPPGDSHSALETDDSSRDNLGKLLCMLYLSM